MNDWMLQGACRNHDPDKWYAPYASPGRRGVPGVKRLSAAQLEAIGICRSCPVRGECLNASLGEQHGIWGGVDEKQRRAFQVGSLTLDDLVEASAA